MIASTNLVTFVGEEKLIIVHDGVTLLNVELDLYFSWKFWAVQNNNTAFFEAFTWSFGIPDAYGVMSPIFYLLNGWRLRTWEGDHTLTLKGHVYAQEGGSVFVPTLELHTIRIQLEATAQTTLPDATVNQINAMASQIQELLLRTSAQSATMTAILNNTYETGEHLNKLEDLLYELLGFRANYKIINPVYKENGVTNSTVQTFKNRADMLAGTVLKTYTMTTDYDATGRLDQFRVIESTAPPAVPAPVPITSTP